MWFYIILFNIIFCLFLWELCCLLRLFLIICLSIYVYAQLYAQNTHASFFEGFNLNVAFFLRLKIVTAMQQKRR